MAHGLYIIFYIYMDKNNIVHVRYIIPNLHQWLHLTAIYIRDVFTMSPYFWTLCTQHLRIVAW